MMLNSNYAPLRPIVLPPPTAGRQHYMHTFLSSQPTVPAGFEDYLPAVRSLIECLPPFIGECHLTIDEKVVKAGMSQRRPKPHVDGCFMPYRGNWGNGGGSGGWLHNCNNLTLDGLRRMPVIVAASAVGCKVWRGLFNGIPKDDGDLSHISDQLGEGEIVPANYGFLLSADCVHESMILDHDTPRTFIRIALPSDFAYDF